MSEPPLVTGSSLEYNTAKKAEKPTQMTAGQNDATKRLKPETYWRNKLKLTKELRQKKKITLRHAANPRKRVKKNRELRKSVALRLLVKDINLPPIPTPEEIVRLQKINAANRKKYKNTGAEFDLETIFNERPDCIPSILQTVDRIDTTTEGYVVVLDVKKNLPAFHKFFKKQPFYVISAEAPEISYAFSQTINEITGEYRLKKSRTVSELRKKTLDDSREISKRNALDFNRELQENILEIQSAGFNHTREIINELNKRGLKTRQGEEWEIHNFYRAKKQIEKYANS